MLIVMNILLYKKKYIRRDKEKMRKCKREHLQIKENIYIRKDGSKLIFGDCFNMVIFQKLLKKNI